MRKVKKILTVLWSHCRTMSGRELVAFVREVLFQDEQILIYCAQLTPERTVGSSEHAPLIVKGLTGCLEAARKMVSPVPWEFRCDIFDGVTDFFVHEHGGTVGHISWIYYHGDPNRILRLAPGDCEVKFCLTLPAFRGKGLYTAALHAIQEDLVSRGYRRCFICVRYDNVASIRGIEKAGFVRTGSVRLRRAFGFQVTRPVATDYVQHEGA